MAKPMVKIHDVETGEIIEREMNAQELADHKARIEAKAQELANKKAKALEKAELLGKLGITEDEAKLLLS